MRSAAHGILLLAIISVDCAVAAWPAQVETATFESPAWKVPPHVPPILARPAAASGR